MTPGSAYASQAESTYTSQLDNMRVQPHPHRLTLEQGVQNCGLGAVQVFNDGHRAAGSCSGV